MSFRLRLALVIVAILVVIQASTALLVYEVTRAALIGEGRRQLAAAAEAFVRQLDDISVRVADNVQVLSLDYALRAAIAQSDRDTVLSALRNHGRRVGAARMLQLSLDGRIQADTAPSPALGQRLPFADLAGRALERPAAALVAWDGAVYWTVVVPVFAPDLKALIAAAIPVDDALLARMQHQSALPRAVELAVDDGAGHWRVAAHGEGSVGLASALAGTGALLREPQLQRVGAQEFVLTAVRLDPGGEGAPVAAVMGYSLDQALQPYRRVALAWAALLGLGLLAGGVGALAIARGVSRPIEQLAASARRIAAGDYAAPPTLPQRDEIGALAAAFARMTQAIGEREERIRFQAGHDAVTGLPHRTAALEAIAAALGAAPQGALLMIALARLPEIVKTMGHAIGDGAMRDAALRLRAPAQDGLLGRATDSEFMLWLPRAERADAIAQAFRVLDALGAPYQEAELSLDTAPTVGIALCPSHGREPALLLQRAEVALFGALGGEEPVAVYDPATDPHRPERLSLMADLRAAIDRQDLRLHYQPKLHLASGTLDGVEGLVRWQHPRLGSLPPDAFVGLAEETGNVRRLTRWVLAAAIAQAQAWHAQGRVLRTAVNLSVRDLDDAELPQRVAELLAVHGLPPERLALEVTESAVMGKPEAAIGVLRRLAEQGIDLAIDDFGVGQSSFAYLRRLPVRELKIDKAFVLRLGQSDGDRTIVRSIVELGQRLGYRVTAEGVEDRAALDFLAAVGCDHAQGYYIARPAAAAALDGLLARRWQDEAAEAT